MEFLRVREVVFVRVTGRAVVVYVRERIKAGCHLPGVGKPVMVRIECKGVCPQRDFVTIQKSICVRVRLPGVSPRRIQFHPVVQSVVVGIGGIGIRPRTEAVFHG